MRKLLSSFLLSFSLAVAAIASPVKSNLGGDGMDNCTSPESTAQLYIQDGLIAMWDGLENVGLASHSDASRKWLDLVGGIAMPIQDGSFFDGDALQMGSDRYAGTCAFSQASSIRTIEICFSDIETEGRWIEVNSPNIGFYTQFGKLNMYVSATTQPKTAKIPSLTFGTVTIVYDDAFAADAYFNGRTMTRDKGTTTTVSASKNRITVGGRYYNPQGTLVPLKGRFHSVRLYNRRLDVEEIEQNYLVDIERFGL